MPLIRRIPKRGFNNARFTVRYSPVNLGGLEAYDHGARVDEAGLRSAGLVNGKSAGVKILGTGTLTKKLTVVANAFSASAKIKIEALGGTCELVAAQPMAPAEPAKPVEPAKS